jgi:activator of HSP90 ATPase
MTFRFTLHATIPATPREIYDTWLSSKGHRAMTGGAVARMSPKRGAKFMAWNGYITGRNLTLVPGRRIVQSWRTTKFTKDDPDSQIEVVLARAPRGTRLTLRHTNVPDGHFHYRDGGWQKSYFKPMRDYFRQRRQTQPK